MPKWPAGSQSFRRPSIGSLSDQGQTCGARTVIQFRKAFAVSIWCSKVTSFRGFKKPFRYRSHRCLGRQPLFPHGAIELKLLVRRSASGLDNSQVLDLRPNAQCIDIVLELTQYLAQDG